MEDTSLSAQTWEVWPYFQLETTFTKTLSKCKMLKNWQTNFGAITLSFWKTMENMVNSKLSSRSWSMSLIFSSNSFFSLSNNSSLICNSNKVLPKATKPSKYSSQNHNRKCKKFLNWELSLSSNNINLWMPEIFTRKMESHQEWLPITSKCLKVRLTTTRLPSTITFKVAKNWSLKTCSSTHYKDLILKLWLRTTRREGHKEIN